MPAGPPRYARDIPAPTPRLAWTRTDTIITVLITLAGIISRFTALGRATGSGTPVFDEKHYVPQAFDMVQSTSNPLIGGIESNPGYGLVVHPPLAKQLIALGEYIFGYTPWGWRLMTAIFGVLVLVMIYLLGREISRSRWVGGIAALLATIDGVLVVASRFGMLDIFLTLFVLTATYALARDHEDTLSRFHAAYTHNLLHHTDLGPYMGFRWWRFAAGVSCGLALSVKWSGLYYMAFFGLYLVAHDYWLRRRYTITKPLIGAITRDGFASFFAIVIVPIIIYALSWRAWFASETSVYRHARAQGLYDDDSYLSLLPDALGSWIYYHRSVLSFHASLTTSNGHHHPWESKPFTWLVSGRPILYLSDRDITCFGGQTCDRLIYMFGVPTVWWLTIPVLLWALWMTLKKHTWATTLPLYAFAAGFIPWVIGYDRQMYFFYATGLVPFTLILLAQALDRIRTHGIKGNTLAGERLVQVYLALCVASFFFWLPIIYGIALPKPIFDSLLWMPSWK
ncbi:dolichyl-phosphate-mannose--protein mannosyltransferase [Corynebacterium aquilae]|uniref:Polyprenol-phosphate-mannose--protein mannosyltransferase n=1 Tax=Corynebacterium aquilae DSM 44791 TaxID=1431546 RepID=A0A1L7CEV3_9CORY|nr:dolichyl-phosphate-mannose--protein mannosyltransferase [Corynebacterium aquilae DSM 44791]